MVVISAMSVVKHANINMAIAIDGGPGTVFLNGLNPYRKTNK
jgi:hypothetical protein